MDGAWVEQLIADNGDKVRRYMFRHVSNRQDAEDLVQEVFLSCFRHRDKFDPQRCTEQAWLFVIARNRLKQYYRDHKPQSSLDEMAETGQEPSDDVAAQAIQLVECRETVARLLLALDERSRTVLVLRYFGGRSNREIAEELGLTEANVRVVQTRALARLRELAAEQ